MLIKSVDGSDVTTFPKFGTRNRFVKFRKGFAQPVYATLLLIYMNFANCNFARDLPKQ